MPYGSVTLVPGVNAERTPTLLEAGYSQSQLMRFRDGLAQKHGGWSRFYANALNGVPRDLHAWEDLNQVTHLGVGTTTSLYVITNNLPFTITPQTLTSNISPNFTTTLNSTAVQITDTNISNVTTFDTIVLQTPISIGGIVLSGVYPIVQITGTSSYEITSATAATSGVSGGGAVPVFATTSTSYIVKVTINNHALSVGNSVVFPLSTTLGGVTILGTYEVVTVVDSNNFYIFVSNQATSSTSASMNSGNAEIVYYINQAPPSPPSAGSGYGTGGYGNGVYGIGTSGGGGGGGAQQPGIVITATDWTQDNWGQILLACPANGGVYQWNPTAGAINAGLVASAPVYSGGLFVSTTQQILVCWASTVQQAIGIAQDPLWVNWSNVSDFTNFIPTTTDQAGGYRIPKGSRIVGGMATPNQNLIWTDEDCWAMNYLGPPFVFGFNMIGAGAGLISSHAAQSLRGGVFWMGPSNFFSYTANGVNVIPCPVWDIVFQNLNTSFVQNIRALPNTPFNEAGWSYPSSASVSGENDSYVKFNIVEPNAPWDYGSLARSSWTDLNVYGNPLGTNPQGVVYQYETSMDADGQAIVSSFQTGYFYIAQGEDYCFVDQVIPDFRYGFYGQSQGATLSFTFFVTNYEGDAPLQYGPYAFNSTTEFIPVRFRGRLISILVQSSDLGSFWRLGRIMYRWAPCGRR
jgi:hypothetical protein